MNPGKRFLPEHATVVAPAPSELATIAIAVWAATRFREKVGNPVGLLIATCLIWLLATVALPWLFTRVRRAYWSTRCMAWILVVVAFLCQGHLVTNSEAGAFGIMLGLGLLLSRVVLIAAADLRPIGEGIRSGLIQLLAVGSVYPFLSSRQVGLGDYFQYSLTLADFARQIRAGVFPVFVGQSEYAFNGAIHSLRTAPYFAYLGGALDQFTLRTLSPFGLLNLCVMASAWMGGVSAYVALRISMPKAPWTAAAVAALYIFCPGNLVPLYSGDMVATFMAMPAVPWFVLGVCISADEPRRGMGWMLQAVALAAMWWAHPPVALWATGLAALLLGANLVTVGFDRASLARLGAAGCAFALLTLYVFVSVSSLGLTRIPGRADQVMQSVESSWRGSLEPIAAASGTMLTDLQLGYGLGAVALVGLALSWRSRASRFLFSGMGLLAVLLFPIPHLTVWLWRQVPPAIISVTNRWPMQRFYVILAGLAAFGGVRGLGAVNLRRRASVLMLGACFACALGWSVYEVRRLMVRAELASPDPQAANLALRPVNLVLTPPLYVMALPANSYYSNAPVSPLLETRLFGRADWRFLADGSTPEPGTTNFRSIEVALWVRPGTSNFYEKVAVAPHHTVLLTFDFLGAMPCGELKVSGVTMAAVIPLPLSGGGKAFGSGPESGRTIAFTNDSPALEMLGFAFVPTASPLPERTVFARIMVQDLAVTPRALALKGLVPFQMTVDSPTEAVLETPRLFIPGYEARVNGVNVPVFSSAERLVTIPVPQGRSDVILRYRGSVGLRIAFWCSIAGWMGVVLAIIFGHRTLTRVSARAILARLDFYLAWALVRLWKAAVIAAFAAATVLLICNYRVRPFQPVRMTLTLPWGKVQGSEPLLVTGHAGHADVVYVQYAGPGLIRVSHDQWSRGGASSTSFRVDFSKPQVVDIGLAPRSAGLPGSELRVVWQGATVLEDPVVPFPVRRTETCFGSNAIGASSCAAFFSGQILAVDR